MTMLDFAEKIVLVTGSSRGIGEGMVRAFAKLGAKCVINYVNDTEGRNESDAERIAREISAPLVIECNVSDHAHVGEMIEEIASKLGGLDILVNNAGILRDRTIKKMTREDFDAVIQVNLGGAFNTIQHAAN